MASSPYDVVARDVAALELTLPTRHQATSRPSENFLDADGIKDG
jgi:hypothetical protein